MQEGRREGERGTEGKEGGRVGIQVGWREGGSERDVKLDRLSGIINFHAALKNNSLGTPRHPSLRWGRKEAIRRGS